MESVWVGDGVGREEARVVMRWWLLTPDGGSCKLMTSFALLLCLFGNFHNEKLKRNLKNVPLGMRQWEGLVGKRDGVLAPMGQSLGGGRPGTQRKWSSTGGVRHGLPVPCRTWETCGRCEPDKVMSCVNIEDFGFG